MKLVYTDMSEESVGNQDEYKNSFVDFKTLSHIDLTKNYNPIKTHSVN